MENAITSRSQELEILFKKMTRGDQNAFDEFYNAMKKPLLAYCLAILRDEEEARDAFHTTVMKIFEARDSFRGGNVHAWIFTIARNTSRSIVRHNKHHVDFPDGFDVAIEENGGLALEESEIVQRAIAKLPEEFRQVILLKYFGEMSVAEIAESESISVDLVKTRLHRARQRLAELLGSTFKMQYERS